MPHPPGRLVVEHAVARTAEYGRRHDTVDGNLRNDIGRHWPAELLALGKPIQRKP
ncbi:MAG: hypothetical protein IOC34_33360 [Burkholderia sp.]|jgi:hypothetical protein|nr:hypothetical protein [Burkholderia sp.]MCA3870621.1 hypothetical protein [Burkholderia sp.]